MELATPGRATGRSCQPGGPHAEDRCVHVGGRIRPRGRQLPYCPHTARIRGVNERRTREPPAQPGETARGTGGNPPRAARGLASKGRQAGGSRTPSHQPLWGFLLFVTFACAGREGEGDDAALRRRKEDVNQLGTRTRERGAGSEEDDRRREHLPRQRTPPSLSRPRLHHRPTVSTARPLCSLLPLGPLPAMVP
jgi:hypothetical protein